MKNLLLTKILLMCSFAGMAQIIDNLGLITGATYTNQLYNYKNITIENPNKDYKIGMCLFLMAEKQLNKTLTIRTTAGYIQKGFKNNLELVDQNGTSFGAKNKNVIFHDLSLDLGIKISPFDLKLNPYLLLGFRGDYMIAYKDIIVVEPGSGLNFSLYEGEIEDYNKMNLGGIIGLGMEINQLFFFEFEYNPAITKKIKSPVVDIKDNCWALRFGVKIWHFNLINS